MADGIPGQRAQDDDRLTYRGEIWSVESKPVVIETDGDAQLVEVWVKRGEDIGESS